MTSKEALERIEFCYKDTTRDLYNGYECLREEYHKLDEDFSQIKNDLEVLEILKSYMKQCEFDLFIAKNIDNFVICLDKLLTQDVKYNMLVKDFKFFLLGYLNTTLPLVYDDKEAATTFCDTCNRIARKVESVVDVNGEKQ